MCDHITAPAPDRSLYNLDKSGIAAAESPAACGKACTHVGGHTIWVKPEWWASISSQGRAFALAHELAHVEGIRPEPEADKRAGAIMCHWGFTRGVCENAAREVVKSRNAQVSARAGWDLAREHGNKPC